LPQRLSSGVCTDLQIFISRFFFFLVVLVWWYWFSSSYKFTTIFQISAKVHCFHFTQTNWSIYNTLHRNILAKAPNKMHYTNLSHIFWINQLLLYVINLFILKWSNAGRHSLNLTKHKIFTLFVCFCSTQELNSGLMLAKKALYQVSHSPSPFWFQFVSEIGSPA
jgi:hypothetical protein